MGFLKFGRDFRSGKVHDGDIVTRHIADGAVTTPKVADEAITAPKVPATFIQQGTESVSLPFAVAGEENVSVSITFPVAFPTGVVPSVHVEIEGADVGIVSVAVTETGFTVTVRDDKGTDYTAAVTATLRWTAVVKSKRKK